MNVKRGLTKALTVITAGMLLMSFASAEEAGEEKEKISSIGVFVGLAEEGRRDNGLALGIEGSHFFTRSWGVGGVVEYTFGDFDALVVAVPVVYRTGKWKLFAGPGFEDGEGSDDTEFLVRIGTEYGFEVGSIEIAPQLNVDFVDGDAVLVIGALFAYGF